MARSNAGTDMRTMLVCPGSLDELGTDVAVPGVRDVPPMFAQTGRVLRGCPIVCV
jgi:hypothetical protein